MTPQKYSNKLVEEYEYIIWGIPCVCQHEARAAAIKCAIKHVEAVIEYLPSGYSFKFPDESLTYLKSLL